jgi:hypothetical protein
MMKKITFNILFCISLYATNSFAQCTFTNYTLTPSGNVCAGSVVITLSGSQQGVSYQLKDVSSGGGSIGNPVAGTGAALTWTLTVSPTNGRSYVVYATKTGCTNTNVVVGSTYINGIAPLTPADVTVTANYGGILYKNDSVTFTVTKSSTGNAQQSLKNLTLLDGPAVGSTDATVNNTFVVKTLPVHGSVYTLMAGSAVCGSAMVNCPVIKAAPPTPPDTLAWLQSAIIAKSSSYIGKPFSVLMDSIQAHGMNMYYMDCLRAIKSDDAPAHTRSEPGDTVWSNGLSFYFKPTFSGIYFNQHNHNPDINTHVPYLIVRFIQKVPFPSPFTPDGTILGPVLNLVRPYVISSIQLKEW